MDNYLAIEHDLAEHNADTSFDPPFPDAEPYVPEHRKHLTPEVQAHHAKLDEEYAEPEDGGYEYAKYDDTVPASLDEDGTLPEYSIYARYWPSPDEKKDRKPVQYSKLACGHKLRGSGFEPNHRNCERCHFTFFQINGELTKAIVEAHQVGGDALIVRLKGKTFLHNFKKFMSTVALIQSQQEAANARKEPTT